MLATFIHTAGLTGAEVGIAAGTAFLNQKLLGALFGEAAMVELVARARDRLRVVLAETFAEERDQVRAAGSRTPTNSRRWPASCGRPPTTCGDCRSTAARRPRLSGGPSDAARSDPRREMPARVAAVTTGSNRHITG